ncbi:MAG TPA: hypothetical protein VJJ80_02985 [Patescibacteria group bacterium]|nr:hypothetical protein [Patescibacteria group bacterium]
MQLMASTDGKVIEPRPLTKEEIEQLLGEANFHFSSPELTPDSLIDILARYRVLLAGHWEVLHTFAHSLVWPQMSRVLLDPKPGNRIVKVLADAFANQKVNVVVAANYAFDVFFGTSLAMELGARLVLTDIDNNGFFKEMRAGDLISGNEKALVATNVILDSAYAHGTIKGILNNGLRHENLVGIATFVTTPEYVENQTADSGLSPQKINKDFCFRALLSLPNITFHKSECPMCKPQPLLYTKDYS